MFTSTRKLLNKNEFLDKNLLGYGQKHPKIDDFIGKVVKITGTADATIKTDDKEFSITYYSTEDGYFSSGSEWFRNSLLDYISDTDTFKILKIKTKKGHTYKASPIFIEKGE